MTKPRYAGRFVPYRKPKNPVVEPVDQARAEFTTTAAELLQMLALAMDIYQNKGAITIRDSNDNIWEISIQRSDARHLACETDLGRKP